MVAPISDEGDDFLFQNDDEQPAAAPAKEKWKILIVDDEKGIHEVTRLTLKNFSFEDKELEFHSAYSDAEARRVIAEHPDMAIVLLDVVMEEDDSGLKFAKHVREELKNMLVRIILRTGQPGFAPQSQVTLNYDINDYKEKTELTKEKLVSSLVMALRAYRSLQSIEDSRKNIKDYIKSTEQFVPRTFLDQLNKDKKKEVKSGDYIEQEMTALFLDTRSFSSQSESLTPAESLQFINSCIRFFEPTIIEYNGFIDKYIGDAVMALFKGTPDNAIHAANKILANLREHNVVRVQENLTPLKVGIGVNTGLLTLGTIGFHDRLDITVISDALSLATKLEKLNRDYGTSLLVSEQTMSKANKEVFHCRWLGKFPIPGKKELISVYEVFDSDVESMRKLKTETKKAFEEAVNLYMDQKLLEASKAFKKILEINPNDETVKQFIRVINQAASTAINQFYFTDLGKST